MTDVAAMQEVSLELSHRFDAPPDRVFDAWVTKTWCEWLGPAVARCELVAMDPRVGGQFHVRMHMPDRVVDITGEYRELKRPERLVMSWIGDCTRFDTTITVTFRRDGAGTLMTLRQEGFKDPTVRDGFVQGWSAPGNSFDKLERVLAR
ncbi:MAG TPA: SRPBCC domain-containing protein [Stellaceae bacterium]|nr:SRPBCC domain-containing protein [Stellaceae bacterium]